MPYALGRGRHQAGLEAGGDILAGRAVLGGLRTPGDSFSKPLCFACEAAGAADSSCQAEALQPCMSWDSIELMLIPPQKDKNS